MAKMNLDVTGLSEEKFEKGDEVISEGTKGDKVYILKEGSVVVEANGNELCKCNAPGTILGEISVLLDSNHTATVTAEQPTSFYVISDLMAYFDSNPKACVEVAQTLAARVMNMNHHFLEIKQEVELMQSSKSSGGVSKLHSLMVKMDAFWGRDIFSPHDEGSR